MSSSLCVLALERSRSAPTRGTGLLEQVQYPAPARSGVRAATRVCHVLVVATGFEIGPDRGTSVGVVAPVDPS